VRPFSPVSKPLLLALVLVAVALSAPAARVAAGATAGLVPCGWIQAKGAPARVILMQGAPLRNGACTYARRLAVRCVSQGSAQTPWRCRRHPYPNKAILAVVERKNPGKTVLVDRGGPIGE
jgi:hypothetical protein